MKNKLVFIGLSGHSLICNEIAFLNNIQVEGYHDFTEKKFNPYNIKYLGPESFNKIKNQTFISIADNLIRKEISKKINRKFLNTNLIHPSAIISKEVSFKPHLLVCANATINPFTNIGFNTIINTSATIEHESIIGDFVHIGPGSTILGNVKVGNNSFIGSNSVVKQGVSIGENVIIGAGSVVLDDVPNNFIGAGNPVKKII